MYAFLWANIWDLIFYAVLCYVFSVVCELATKRGSLFGYNLVRGREPFMAFLICFIVVILAPPVSWLVAVYSVIDAVVRGRRREPAGD